MTTSRGVSHEVSRGLAISGETSPGVSGPWIPIAKNVLAH